MPVTEEIQDIYDRERRPQGYTKRRGEPLEPGEFIVAVGIWVINDRRELLLTKRSPEKRFAPGKWENTGGHLMAGEDPLAAVLRELREETGLCAAPENVLYLGTSCSPPYLGSEYAVYMNADISSIRLQPGETCDARWVSLDEFNAMAERGEMADSVTGHLQDYREAFLNAVAGEKVNIV